MNIPVELTLIQKLIAGPINICGKRERILNWFQESVNCGRPSISNQLNL